MECYELDWNRNNMMHGHPSTEKNKDLNGDVLKLNRCKNKALHVPRNEINTITLKDEIDEDEISKAFNKIIYCYLEIFQGKS